LAASNLQLTAVQSNLSLPGSQLLTLITSVMGYKPWCHDVEVWCMLKSEQRRVLVILFFTLLCMLIWMIY